MSRVAAAVVAGGRGRGRWQMWALCEAEDLSVLVWQPAPGRGGVRGRWQQCGGGWEETGATPRRKAG